MLPESPAAEQTIPNPPRWHRRNFSRLGLGLSAGIVANNALSLAATMLFSMLDKLGVLALDRVVNTLPFWIMAYVLPSLLGLWVFWLTVRRVPAASPEQRPLPPLPFLKMYFIAAATLFIFSFFTELLLSLIASLRGAPVINPVDIFSEMPLHITFLLTCVVAPVVEELTYRQLLIPRLRPYGDRFAVLASALCFALMHGNLSQFFYAFALGVVLGHVFLKTGCVWQTILLHALINLVGGVVPMLAEAYGDTGSSFYLCFTLCHIGLGAFCFLYRRKAPVYGPGTCSLRTGQTWRLFLVNFGVILFFLMCLLLTAMNLME